MKNKPSKINKIRAFGFSLIEVVVAVGVFGIAVVALLGVLSATGRTVSDLADGDAAIKLAANVEAEMRRYALTRTDFDDFASNIPAAGVGAGLVLVANQKGDRVVIETAADNNISAGNATLPVGMKGRDRYFRLVVRSLPAPLDYTNGDGYIALSVSVEWPFQLPLGPDDPASSAVGTEGNDYSVTPVADRNVYVLNLAVTP
jgi:type II secretory pathway pseudopilin PulG